jgi:hypothetical protein
MAQPRRKCRLADPSHKGVDLRLFENEIIQTINNTVPGKHPAVFQNYFSTDPLSPGEAVAVGRALSKIDDLKYYGKTVTIFRLFDGKTYESEISNKVIKRNNIKKKGGRMT